MIDYRLLIIDYFVEIALRCRFEIGFDWVCISYLVSRIAYRVGGLGLNWVCIGFVLRD